MALSEQHPHQILYASDKLPVSFMNIDSHLRNQGISCGKLGQCETCNGELADADHANPELGQRQNTAGKLADRYYTSGWHRTPGRSVLE